MEIEALEGLRRDELSKANREIQQLNGTIEKLKAAQALSSSGGDRRDDRDDRRDDEDRRGRAKTEGIKPNLKKE